MPRPERPFADGERPPIQLFGLRMLAELVFLGRHVGEAQRSVGVVGSEALLANDKRPPEQT